jgi:hypothetical protein
VSPRSRDDTLISLSTIASALSVWVLYESPTRWQPGIGEALLYLLTAAGWLLVIARRALKRSARHRLAGPGTLVVQLPGALHMVEVEGRVVAAIAGASREEAIAHTETFGFTINLGLLTHADGSPLRRSRESPIIVRDATEQERQAWASRHGASAVGGELMQTIMPYGP